MGGSAGIIPEPARLTKSAPRKRPEKFLKIIRESTISGACASLRLAIHLSMKKIMRRGCHAAVILLSSPIASFRSDEIFRRRHD